MGMTMIMGMTIKHTYQPTGNSCGPTCLFMINEYLATIHRKVLFTIKDIEGMCQTDWVVGTPPDRMERGMKYLDIKYIEYIGSPRPHELLQSVLDSKNIPILRTITKGVPHWIIINGYQTCKDDTTIIYQVLDPWQGKINYNEQQLNEVWKQRDFQFFEVIVKHFIDPLTDAINLTYNPLDINQDYYL